MKGKSLALSAMVTLLIFVALPSVSSAPLSEMKHVTLHVRSEILDDHKIVITLEPLGNDSKENVPVEFHDSADVKIVNRGKSTESAKNETFDASAEFPANSSSSASANETTSTTTTASPETGVVSARPTTAEDGFIVQFPEVKCPSGQKHDPNGKCREIYFSSNAGKSMDSFNFLRKSKNFHKKYWGKPAFA